MLFPQRSPFKLSARALLLACTFMASFACAQTPAPTPKPTQPAAPTHYTRTPAFDLSSMDKTADPCDDFYQYACGNFATNHPIPADETEIDPYSILEDVITEKLSTLLTKYATPNPKRTPDEQKIGDDYAACMNTTLIEQKGLTPLQPLLNQIDSVTPATLLHLIGELQRVNVNIFFAFGVDQDFRDSSKQVALVDQGGFDGLPCDDDSCIGAKGRRQRKQFTDHVANVLTLLGEPYTQASDEAKGVLALETKLSNSAMDVVESQDPEKAYNPQTMAEFTTSLGMPFDAFLDGIHSPHVGNLINQDPPFFASVGVILRDMPLPILKAYMKFQTATAFDSVLPHTIDDEDLRYATLQGGGTEQTARSARCTAGVDDALGEALGQVYVQQFFPAQAKTQALRMVRDIEEAMDRDIDTLDWMSPAMRSKSREKLHQINNKIGYPDHWRDYAGLDISPTDPFGNKYRARAFENDRQLDKIGKPVNRQQWDSTTPTVNAFYSSSLNDITVPAGILQPPFFDATSGDIAINYGHIGATIGHELTHAFDNEGRKFDGLGNMVDWWTPEDKTRFETRMACVVNEYNHFTAIGRLHVDGELTLSENLADIGGASVAYMAYLDRARKTQLNIDKKIDGFTGPQRFYIALAQDSCENEREQALREDLGTELHAPGRFRVNGVILNQPTFAKAFACKQGSAMVADDPCRVW